MKGEEEQGEENEEEVEKRKNKIMMRKIKARQWWRIQGSLLRFVWQVNKNKYILKTYKIKSWMNEHVYK